MFVNLRGDENVSLSGSLFDQGQDMQHKGCSLQYKKSA